MNSVAIATEMRTALIGIGCLCTHVETSWRDGSSKFLVCNGPGKLRHMHSRTIAADGTMTVTRLV